MLQEQEYREIFKDVYNFYRHCMASVANEGDIDPLAIELRNICVKHKSLFCNDLIVAVARELEREKKTCKTRAIEYGEILMVTWTKI